MREFHASTEGYASFRGFKTRFRVFGKGRSRPPLLCIHGGPGYGADYLEPLADMASTGRRVVFYDQLGCGGSDHPGEAIDWSLGLFLEELEVVRDAAGLSRCHVLGHGWGGMLALEHAVRGASGLESLVLSSAVASVGQWRLQTIQLLDELPEEVRAPLVGRHAAGMPASQPCRCSLDAFLRRHLCLVNPWPECLQRSVAEARAHPEARRALFGQVQPEPAGRLANWDMTGRLHEIGIPTLVVSGRHDLVPPASSAALYQGITSSEWVVFEHSAHVPHLEETQRYLEVLDGFLGKTENVRRRPT